ncbi:putative zn 2cys6 transcription factor [Diplodia seriata]|uniref:Putative zn 2cys6 transcription factor n=1 Tax=Diplodia seriata TaxID=420778 RepID=A0A0G2FZD2_9PEZI|nr:putative zn 2cys6 transcription factor [Diplodia seriata]
MRVNIWPHDTTESIVATVKNFHGIYDGQGYGVSFEDRHGNTLIASDSEAGEGSVTSSRRDNVASAEISLDNIVEGGRRKRAKFDSSPHGHRPRTRGTGQGIPRNSYGGVLPTPDPTIGGSVISDEDVALQLMRLGDASNFSSHGRQSTSTIDDALSGKAELASSDECSDDGSEVDEFPAYTESLDTTVHVHDHDLHRYDSADESDEYDDRESFRGDSDEVVPDDNGMGRPIVMKKRAGSLVTKLSTKMVKSRVHSSKNKVKTPTVTKAPISPTSLPPASRKTSSASLSMPTFAPDEEDLSTKPRCQRCRKSKKGCDRQRPCQRCKDAGIGHDGCVSEDEGNGRKGRYGRHMGVPVKKIIPDAPTFHESPSAMGGMGGYSALTAAADKNKKRKR